MTAGAGAAVGRAGQGTTLVLLTLAAGQFLMTLDSSVMNVSIATVARGVGTSVTGIQGAIMLYTLVMAMLMVTGSKVGSRPGPVRSPRAHAAGMSPLPKERLAEKLLTSGGLGRAGIVGLLRDGRLCLLVLAASGRPSSDRRKGRRR